jgi:hypothetical protein
MYGEFQGGSAVPQYSNNTTPPEYQNMAGAPPQYQATGGYGGFGQGDRFEWDSNALLNDPGFQFTKDQALQATTRQQNAGGNQFSGNILAALQDRGGGLAASYGQDFRRSAANENAMNYGRDVGEYGMDVARNQDMYNRNVQNYGIDAARNQDVYGRGVQDYNILAGREKDIYGRGVTDYGLGLQGNQLQYGRDVGEYGMNVARNQDQYGRTQNYLSRLEGLSGSGQNAAAQLGAFGQNTANTIGNIYMQNAANQQGMYQGINNAIQGSIGNYLTHDLYSNMPGWGKPGLPAPMYGSPMAYN